MRNSNCINYFLLFDSYPVAITDFSFNFLDLHALAAVDERGKDSALAAARFANAHEHVRILYAMYDLTSDF